MSCPTLFTGICFCAYCDCAMTPRTGRKGRIATTPARSKRGRARPAVRPFDPDGQDNLIADHIADRLVQPEQLEEVLTSVLDRRQEHAERRRVGAAYARQSGRCGVP
ncbi:MAG TPA: zinc ribbon domain-containing protein [Xanthobacteraceae bacterium]|nr:zinc ribbon domain-containing protein [Xanthobacteraceae bacterium]